MHQTQSKHDIIIVIYVNHQEKADSITEIRDSNGNYLHIIVAVNVLSLWTAYFIFYVRLSI